MGEFTAEAVEQIRDIAEKLGEESEAAMKAERRRSREEKEAQKNAEQKPAEQKPDDQKSDGEK